MIVQTFSRFHSELPYNIQTEHLWVPELFCFCNNSSHSNELSSSVSLHNEFSSFSTPSKASIVGWKICTFTLARELRMLIWKWNEGYLLSRTAEYYFYELSHREDVDSRLLYRASPLSQLPYAINKLFCRLIIKKEREKSSHNLLIKISFSLFMCLSTSPSNDSKREKMLENGKWNLSCLTSHRVRHSSAVADRNKSCRSCCVSQSAFSPLSLLHYNRRKLLNISFLSFYCVRSPSLLVFLISTIIWIIAEDRRLEERGSSAPVYTNRPTTTM